MRVWTSLATCVLVAIGSNEMRAQAPARGSTSAAAPVEKVTGIGGFFFKATDPKALAAWYERNLGINLTPTSYDGDPWRQEAGVTVFAPFASTTKYFGRETQQWMINFRVRDLDAMAAQLRRAGITVEVDKETYPNGRFARLADPEGNPIQLWQPMNERKN